MQIFIGGSREITTLDPAVQARIDNIMQPGYTVLIGDANGADKAVQQYLLRRDYRAVSVYCAGGHCRNNLGQWPVQAVTPPHLSKDFAFYAAKDAAMAQAADYGLMLWNGTSAGTLRNVLDLVKRARPIVVYWAGQRRFYSISSSADLKKLLAQCPAEVIAGFDRKLNLSQELAALAAEPTLTQQLNLLP